MGDVSELDARGTQALTDTGTETERGMGGEAETEGRQ